MGKKKTQALLITVSDDGQGGRAQLSKMFRMGLAGIENQDLEVLRLAAHTRCSIVERISGRIDGITAEIEKKLYRRICENPPDIVILDGSNLGRLVRLIKRTAPELPVITFFHNVETRFFFDAFRAAPSVRALGVLAANTLAERWAARYSDRRIMLNERDARLLEQFHGRPGTDLLPMALRDQHDPAALEAARPHNKPYALFVGGAFYANVEGMAWYARNVAPRAPMDTVVIGRGMEAHQARLEKWGGVHVVGSVDELGPWYAHAQIIVAPILSGSGMKTKTAEALMHGKPIAGTAEAFEGYDLASSDDLKLCKTPNDFLDALQRAGSVEARIDPKLRAQYLKKHSGKATQDHLKIILEKTYE